MSTRQDVDSFLDFLRSTFVSTDKDTSPLSAAPTIRSISSDATLEQDIALETVADTNAIPEFYKLARKKSPLRHVPFLARMRRANKTGARSPSLPAKNISGGLPAVIR